MLLARFARARGLFSHRGEPEACLP